MPVTLSTNRFWTVNFFLIALFCIIGYQLTQLMIIRRPALVELANRQHQLSIEIPPLRGQILDRHGKELATNLKVPSVYAVPRLAAENQYENLAHKAGKALQLNPKYVEERLAKKKYFVWLKRRASYTDAENIQKIESPVFGVLKEYRRFYPQGDLLAQVLGFTDVDNQGLEGVELYFNRELRGRAGRRYTKRDALGREIKAFEIRQIPALDGNRVTLTIDQFIQYLTERALDRAYKQWKPKGATAIVMEAKTGKIVALANRPTFDPNHYEKSESQSRRNRAITDMFEPGSVFKIVTASAALNENKATPDTLFNCENGAYHYGIKTLHDVHRYGQLTFADVIVKSSNIGAVKIGALLRPEILNDYIHAFGFGRATGIDLPGEASGFVRPAGQWSKTSAFNIPIGQEIMVTALQMTTAMAVIANGGELVQPYLISKIEDQAGVVLKEKKPVIKRRVIRPEVAEIMRGILQRVVTEGTGTKARIKGIPAGGKTGTAQKVLSHGRGYSHSNFMSSFVGFAPADDPQFVMGVVLDDPKPQYYGGTVSAPVFKEVMETALLAMGYVPATAKRLGDSASQPMPIQKIPKHSPRIRPAEALGSAR